MRAVGATAAHVVSERPATVAVAVTVAVAAVSAVSWAAAVSAASASTSASISTSGGSDGGKSSGGGGAGGGGYETYYFSRRERPHLVFGDPSDPHKVTGLTTGVQYGPHSPISVPGEDACYTLFQPVALE